MSTKRSAALQKAIDELASLFQNGELIASYDPSGFVQMVSLEVKGLRIKVATLEQQVRLYQMGIDLGKDKI